LRERAAEERLRGPGLAGSAALHALVVVTFLVAGAGRHRPPLPPFYRVNLVAPPGMPAAAASIPASAAAPAPEKPAPTRARRNPQPPAPKSVRSREPAVPLAKPAAPKPQPAQPSPAAPTTRPAAASAPAQPAGVPGGTPGGTDVATIKTEGVEFPFPGYLQNLVSQVYRRWRPAPSAAALEAEVFFFVHRDGSVTGLQFLKRSGSFGFDLEAQGAIEAAARAGAFGQLPAGYGPDMLPVSFYFNPRSVR
jgi:protein TonB